VCCAKNQQKLSVWIPVFVFRNIRVLIIMKLYFNMLCGEQTAHYKQDEAKSQRELVNTSL